MPARKAITQKEAAELLGVSKPLVRSWVKDGRLNVAAVVGPLKLVWLDEVEAMWNRKTKPGPAPAPKPEAVPPRRRGRPRKPAGG